MIQRAAAQAAAYLSMKLGLRFWILLGLASIWSPGCNWAQISAFRAQMRAITEYTTWTGSGKEILVFKAPLLAVDDLNGVHIYPEMLDGQTAVLRYHRVNTPPGMAVDYEIRLLFAEGKLAGLVLPPPLRDGLGKANILGFFAMMGGGGFPSEVGVGPVPKSQLVSANLFPKESEPLAREVEVLLMPADSRNRPIAIRMIEREKQPGYYSECLISFKRRPEANGAK